MNQRDLENLDFLRSLTPAALENWFSQADDEDKEYAAELLDAWEKELDELMMEAAEVIEINIRPSGVTLH